MRRKADINRHDPDRSNRIQLVDDGDAGTWTVEYRGSAIGGCSRALVCAGLQYDPAPTPDWMQEKYDEGHALEPVVIGWLKEGRGFALRPQGSVIFGDIGQEQAPHVLELGTIETAQGEARLTVHMHSDAMGQYVGITGSNATGECDIEVKCVGDDLWFDFRKGGLANLPHYAYQVSARMHAHSLPVAFVVARKKGSLSAGDLEIIDVLVEIVTTPPIPLRQIKSKLFKIEAALRELIDGGNLTEHMPACDVRQYPCPFYYLHDRNDDEDRTRLEDAILEPQVQAYLDAQARAAQADKDKKAAMEGIKAWMEVNGMGVDGAKYSCAGAKLTFVASYQASRVTEERVDKYVRITAPKKRTTNERTSKKGVKV